MDHTLIVTATELEDFANRRDSESVVPELICLLIKELPDLTACRIPYGDSINQPGWDGLVETENGFRQFIPKKKSYWEINTGSDPQDTATKYFRDRSAAMKDEDRAAATFVFVTPRSSGAGGWNEPRQTAWLNDRKDSGWGGIKIVDGVLLADWLREFPAIGKWLLKKIGLIKTTSGFSTPAEHWDNLQQTVRIGDPPLPLKIFLVGRDRASAELLRVFKGEANQLALAEESQLDTQDFVAAFLESLDDESRRVFANKCIFVSEPDAWQSMANLKSPHVLVAHPNLDLEFTGEQLHMAALKCHAVVLPISGAWAGGSESLIPLRSPSESILQTTLIEGGYSHERALELAGAGASNLASLKRYLRGLGTPPPYAAWETARILAQAELAGRWSGKNPADKAAIEAIVGKSYGEWIEIVRPETLRSDTPLTQRDENWKMMSRGEAWSALGPRLSDDDLDRFQNAAVKVLGERNPMFELAKDERFMANIKGKALQHSASIRNGIAETLALLGSRPKALSFCSQGKPEHVAALTVRNLLKDADWLMWVSIDRQLPLLAEAAPDEFLDAVETALLRPAESPFNAVFAQEGSGITGWNHTTGLLWALETLAWHPDYLMRVTVLLGELAAIDPGGNWANRPANSLATVFLPWHPQTCASIAKRKTAVETLLKEQPSVGWKLILALLPSAHGFTSGSHKPAWRDLIPAGHSEKVTNREYWEQVSGYAELAVTSAASDLSKLTALVDRLPDLPPVAQSRVLEHLTSDAVLRLAESERQPLWDSLLDLAAKHRKYADAQWAMSPNAVTRLEDTAAKIAPKSVRLIHRRLFSNRDLDLYDKKGNWEEQERKLNLDRQTAVQEILEKESITGVLEFVNEVSSPEKVGHALGSVESKQVDADLLPGYLGREEKPILNFMGGFVWSRYWTQRMPWVESTISNAWTVQQKNFFLALLPFLPEVWRLADNLLGEDAIQFWKNARVRPWGIKGDLLEAAEKLLHYKRPWAAVGCIDVLIHEKVTFSPNLAVQALMDGMTAESTTDVVDGHQTQEIIKWLQSQPETDNVALGKVEWGYLRLLDHHFGAAPVVLERQLASDPPFFCDVIRMIFRSDKEEHIKREPTESEKQVAQNAYRLLHGWQTVPGTKADGSFDGDAFTQWLSEVKKRTTDSGHVSIALDQIGKVLPYAKPDPNGLWIHKAVAEALNAKDVEPIRSGFTCELFNMRGVHGFSAGQEEQAIAAGFREKANALEQNGFHRIAAAMRELAKGYERTAEREAQRDPFED